MGTVFNAYKGTKPFFALIDGVRKLLVARDLVTLLFEFLSLTMALDENWYLYSTFKHNACIKFLRHFTYRTFLLLLMYLIL